MEVNDWRLFRRHLGRMDDGDKRLLLFIAQKMARPLGMRRSRASHSA